MLFMVGGGFSIYQGVKGLLDGHHEVPDVTVALIVIAVAIYIKFAGEESLMGDEAEVVTAK
jgi:hypothetical protein